MTGRKRDKRAVKKQRKNVGLEMLGQENSVTIKLQRMKEEKGRNYSKMTYSEKLLKQCRNTWQ